jgi:hypothetical protein
MQCWCWCCAWPKVTGPQTTRSGCDGPTEAGNPDADSFVRGVGDDCRTHSLLCDGRRWQKLYESRSASRYMSVSEACAAKDARCNDIAGR